MNPLHRIALVAGLLALPVSLARSQAAASKPATGKLRGVAYDSVRARPLPLATIQLVSATDPSSARAILTDSLGRFSADSLLPGSWIVGATHPWLDSLAVDQLAVQVDVKAKGTTRALVAVPSWRALVTRVCGEQVARDSSGYVHGLVRRAGRLGIGIPGTVRVQWLELTLTKDGVQRSVEGVDVQSTPEGRYVACGVPVGGALRIRSWTGSDTTGVLDVALPAHGITRLDLAIGEAQRRTISMAGEADSSGTAVADSLAPTEIDVLRGAGSIRGVARAWTRGAGDQPLANARVTVWGSGLEVRSASDGGFALSGLPTGSYILETVAIGYQPSREVIELRPDAVVTVNTRLERLLTLDTVQVRALRRRVLGPNVAGFEERRQRGFGKFLGPDELDRRVASQASDLFRMIPGVRVVPGFGGDRVLLRGDFRGTCVPTMFLDGMRILDMGGVNSINSYVSPMEIRAVEVYVSGAATPPEFSNGLSTCGSIVIWTGARR
jgi:Carboxypeptidase regulatory-like domain/TonB-dependent Receptor Plug Domain